MVHLLAYLIVRDVPCGILDAQTHKTDDVGSRFIYVELIVRKNKVIQRKKIKEEHGSFSNFISLGKEVKEADYQIRTYTHFMRNQGEEFFFTKQVPVYANTTALLIANIEYEQNETCETDKMNPLI